MKNVLFCSLIVFLFCSTSAHADVGGDFQFLKGEGGFGETGTVEYFWSEGKFSGYGFYDSLRSTPLRYFTEHAVYYSLSERFYLASEVTQHGFGTFQKAGFGFSLGDLLATTVPLDVLEVRYYGKAWGASEEQVEVVWSSRQFRVSDGIGMYFSGFANIPDHGSIFTQPQLWFTLGSSKIEVGLEYEQWGKTKNTSLAFKYNF
jgi:hypothetical protein